MKKFDVTNFFYKYKSQVQCIFANFQLKTTVRKVVTNDFPCSQACIQFSDLNRRNFNFNYTKNHKKSKIFKIKFINKF